MARDVGFIRKHDLWTHEQQRQAQAVKERVEKDGLKLFRLAWADPHGVSRAKTLTASSFISALEKGYNINVATATLDASGARVFSSFIPGGGMGLEEMTGSPNLIAVPDPSTFRVLPWEPDVGWILCDEYFTSGKPFHFAPRQLLRKQLSRLNERGWKCQIGLEIEWYLLRLADQALASENVSRPGVKGKAPKAFPVESGFSYHSESNMDLMHSVISSLANAYDKLGLPLRSIENEFGPGQLECTFAPRDALEAADNLVVFRTATRQITKRMGYLATFMCRPKLDGCFSSGWHLHQSLVEASTGRNVLASTSGARPLSDIGHHYLGGLVHNALTATIFASPTVNGYRRFRANSLAPDRVAWSTDHRGVMLRVLGSPNDPATRIENRIGEPSANPYLYILSQIAAGLDGIDNKRDPGPSDDDPYSNTHVLLPRSLREALSLLEKDPLFRSQLGDTFVDYYIKLKNSELGRFDAFLASKNSSGDDSEITDWEQDEYFDFF